MFLSISSPFTGIGLESAKALAKGGATVVLTGRTEKKGAKAVETVQEYLREEGVQNDKVYTVQLDLDDLENVKSFPQRFQSKMGDAKIDVLMNNAGVMAIPDRQLTKDGYERTFQSNHLVCPPKIFCDGFACIILFISLETVGTVGLLTIVLSLGTLCSHCQTGSLSQ